MSFIDENTAFAKKRTVNKTLHKRAGFYAKDEYGNEIEMGYKSEIIAKSLKDDPSRVRGKAGKLIIFEEAGSFSELGAAWSIARPSVEQDGIAFGLMIAFGTGGDDKKNNFTTLKDMFYHPDGYNCIGFDNIWDNGATEKCGFFCPQYTNLANIDKDGNRLYMDKDGNTKTKEALSYILSLRKEVVENASNSSTVDRYVAENCLDKDTWISTEDGVMRIKDNPKAWITGIKKEYKITTNDGTELLLTDNHKIFNGVEYKELKDYKVGDTIKYYNTIFSDLYQYVQVPGLIPATNTSILIDEEWARFIGLFMGDGCFYGPTGRIIITCDKKDTESIEWIKVFFNSNFGNCVETPIGKNKGGVELSVSRKNSIGIFKALGLLESKSNGHLKRKVCIPEYIMKSPKSVISAFLQGLFDSDGYSSKDGSHLGFFNKDKQILLDIQFLLRGFDIHASINSREAVNGSGYKYIENKLNIRKIDIPKFRDEINFISLRKRKNIENSQPLRKLRDYSYGIITSIEFIKEDEVWDINTETHALSANGIWVHNCITPAEACLSFNGNIFPKKELQQHLANIRTNKQLQNHK
nr:MAG TPA: Terminase large subunit [Caudoviricetes sp.]